MATTSPTFAPAAAARASALLRASSTAAFRAPVSAGLPCDSWNVIPVVRFAPAAVAVSMVSPAFDRSCRVTVIWFWAWYPVTAVPFESYVGYRLTSAVEMSERSMPRSVSALMTAAIRSAFSRSASAASEAWVCTPRPITASSGCELTMAEPVTVTVLAARAPGNRPHGPGNSIGHGTPCLTEMTPDGAATGTSGTAYPTPVEPPGAEPVPPDPMNPTRPDDTPGDPGSTPESGAVTRLPVRWESDAPPVPAPAIAGTAAASASAAAAATIATMILLPMSAPPVRWTWAWTTRTLARVPGPEDFTPPPPERRSTRSRRGGEQTLDSHIS